MSYSALKPKVMFRFSAASSSVFGNFSHTRLVAGSVTVTLAERGTQLPAIQPHFPIVDCHFSGASEY
eukprot:scaffold43660_cov33-Attheya_sp.AAC.1